jgi:MerR family transcriptional regulator, heat shock protein HspR
MRLPRVDQLASVTAAGRRTPELDTPRIKSYRWNDASWRRVHAGVTHMIDHDLYFISMAARLLEMHPQTLRKYERLGLIRPTRTIGSMRVYTQEELDRLRLIKYLVDEAGVNLAGVQRLLEIAEAVQRLRPLIKQGRPESRRRIAAEIQKIAEMAGL